MLVSLPLTYSALCSYRDGLGRLCRCNLYVYLNATCAVVIASEREDNPGASITNSYEHLATGVWQKLGLPLNQTTWIEHYTSEARFGWPETFDQVALTPQPETPMTSARLIEPHWSPFSRTELETLIASPFTG